VNNEWVYEDLDENSMKALMDTWKSGKEPKWGPQIDRNFAEGPDGRTSLYKPKELEVNTDRDFAAAK
jgi:hypothetical protein